MELSDLFVINPSINVSPYCYSIIKIEPYTTCQHNCIYCFGRWYRENEAVTNIIQSFMKIIRSLKLRKLKIIPFRLSTLIDPFQPIEEKYQLSKSIMKLCLKHEIPLIINTKATMLLRGEYLNLIRQLSDKGITIIQISISTINENISKILEPNAPSPIDRLNMAEKLSEKDVPVILRLQPLIPGISDFEAEEIIMKSKYAGVKQIIVEVLRDDVENLKVYEKLAYNKHLYENLESWDSYSPSIELSSKIVRPNIKWRSNVYGIIRDLCNKYGLEFSICKEGFYNYHTAKDCCGMYFMDDAKYVLRPTLHEVWEYKLKHNSTPKFEELISDLPEKYIFRDKLNAYPRILRKKMKFHEKIFNEILGGGKLNILL